MSTQISYNEYKFLVPHEQLKQVRDILGAIHGNSDPFPQGPVDSIYFDTLDLSSYQQCLEGDQVKDKFRIRGYGDGTFTQLHFKQKDLFSVRKLKSRIASVVAGAYSAPDWLQLRPSDAANQSAFDEIMGQASIYGPLTPVLRVKYYRHRYRLYDYRITLDTNIEISGLHNGIDRIIDHMIIPIHVLEIKSITPRPYLPLLGLINLPQISFSKFYMGLNLLTTGELG